MFDAEIEETGDKKGCAGLSPADADACDRYDAKSGKGNRAQPLAHVTLLSLDVTEAEHIKKTAANAIALHSIDVVFNNAEYGLMGALESSLPGIFNLLHTITK